MTARDEVVDLLDGALPVGVDVLPYARQIDPPDRSTVMVRVDVIRPAPESGLWEVDAALVLIVPGPGTEVEAAEAELDGLLEDVLYALDNDDGIPNGVRWTEAKRAVYGEPEPTNPAYEVALTIRTQKEQPTP
jgi:hypothetical protein